VRNELRALRKADCVGRHRVISEPSPVELQGMGGIGKDSVGARVRAQFRLRVRRRLVINSDQPYLRRTPPRSTSVYA